MNTALNTISLDTFFQKSFKIAMKTMNVDYESDKYLIEISKRLDIPIERIYNYIIPMDSKKIVTIRIYRKEESIGLY